MAAITQARNTAQRGDAPFLNKLAIGVAASTVIYQGAMVGLLNGYLTNASANPSITVIGRAEKTYDNSLGADGAITAEVSQGVFKFANSTSTDLITAAHLGLDCYASDNQTVALTSNSGQRPRAGTVIEVASDGVWVEMGLHSISTATLSAASTGRRVRGVVFANVASLAAFTVAGNDGLTYVQGDRVLLTNQTTAAQCGVYVVGVVAAGVAPLTRAADMAAGSVVPNGVVYEVSEGTLWAGSSWKALSTGVVLAGTGDPLFYPRAVRRVVTLVAGAYTFGVADGLFLFSTTTSTVAWCRNTANTSTATTGGYAAPVANRTAGKSGTGALLFRAEAAAGTLNNADISTMDVSIFNW